MGVHGALKDKAIYKHIGMILNMETISLSKEQTKKHCMSENTERSRYSG